MARIIKVDPEKLDLVANDMEKLIGEYQGIYKALYGEVEGMSSAWKGVDNQAFVQQIKEFDNDFQKMIELMSQYRQFVVDSSTAYKKTQSEIVAAAKKLSVGN